MNWDIKPVDYFASSQQVLRSQIHLYMLCTSAHMCVYVHSFFTVTSILKQKQYYFIFV